MFKRKIYRIFSWESTHLFQGFGRGKSLKILWWKNEKVYQFKKTNSHFLPVKWKPMGFVFLTLLIFEEKHSTPLSEKNQMIIIKKFWQFKRVNKEVKNLRSDWKQGFGEKLFHHPGDLKRWLLIFYWYGGKNSSCSCKFQTVKHMCWTKCCTWLKVFLVQINLGNFFQWKKKALDYYKTNKLIKKYLIENKVIKIYFCHALTL